MNILEKHFYLLGLLVYTRTVPQQSQTLSWFWIIGRGRSGLLTVGVGSDFSKHDTPRRGVPRTRKIRSRTKTKPASYISPVFCGLSTSTRKKYEFRLEILCSHGSSLQTFFMVGELMLSLWMKVMSSCVCLSNNSV